MKTLLLVFIIGAASALLSKQAEQTTENSAQHNNDDTINIGYAYWWPYSGPFLFPRDNTIALVFSGKVVRIDPPEEDTSLLYIPQNGVVKIEKIFHQKEVERWSYSQQEYFKSDCFYGMDLKPGDAVLISCYEYEKSYAIPGVKSVLAIKNGDKKVLQSTQKYFNGKYKNLLCDTVLWENYGLKNQFKSAIYYQLQQSN